MWKKREIVVAVTCLVLGSAGQLAQYLVTPLGSEEASAASNVAKAVAHPTAMQSAAWLDLTILFFLPALVVVASLAGARTTRLGWVASVVAIGTTVPGIAYVLAPDVLYVGAIHGDVTARTITAYNNSGVVTAATIVFLIGHVLGMVLLGVALWRVGSVPRWAAVCLAVSPCLEIGSAAVDVRPLGVIAYLLLMAAFGACAAAVARPRTATISAPATVSART
jgi:putative effector of murein hydrolase LrgA (UPF0299 family)